MSKAIVLGASALRVGNIGDAVVEKLERQAWDVWSSDCYNAAWDRYEAPVLKDHTDADALIVTTGATAIEPFPKTSEQAIHDIVYGCLTLPLNAALEYVNTRGEQGGRIVFTGSYAYRHPFTSGTAYCAAKAGLHMATKTLAHELTSLGFRIYIVHPYHVAGTPMWERVQEGVMKDRGWTREQADEYAKKDLKMPDLCTPSEVAEAIVWCATAHAAEWANGTAIEMFGGTR